ncbi:MAG: SDR family NAD(P)-dependent oxidoreductase [bacterium]|nr:SDR family NAD(P)-dependent oxidoreductase [bacterium]
MKRIAIVTGTSRGIGAATATILLERGWSVLGVARGAAPPELEHPAYEHAQLDLADLEQLEAFLGDWSERVDLEQSSELALVNNAAVLAPVELTSSLESSALMASYAINVVAPVWLMGFALRVARGRLRIINVSSGAATTPYPGWSAYCGTKAALHMAGAVLGQELAEAQPTRSGDCAVVAYAPHVVATAMQAEIRAVDEEGFPRRARFHELHENGELLAPEAPAMEIADLCAAESLPPFSARRLEV